MQAETLKLHKKERVCIFRLPPTTGAKGYLLDDWKDIVFQGSVKLFQKGNALRLVFAKKDGLVFAETKLPQNPFQAIVRTQDSSRGFALRLQNPKGGFAWVGLVFRDRNDAFDFNVTIVDIVNLRTRDQQVQKMKDQPLKVFEEQSKIKINGFEGKKKKENAGFGGDWGFFQEKQKVKEKEEFDWGKWQDKKVQAQPKSDWSQFWAQPQPKPKPQAKSKAQQPINLLDL